MPRPRRPTLGARSTTAEPSRTPGNRADDDDDDDDDDDTGDTDGPNGVGGYGCDDPELCLTFHIGPLEDSCPHEVDGAMTNACDAVGTFALRIAVETLRYYEEGGLVVMHDNAGTAADYVGGVNVPGDVTIRAADGADPRDIAVWHEGEGGLFRLREDNVHLTGFTLVCDGCTHPVTTRSDPEVEGTETEHHLIENVILAAVVPEHVGSNSVASPIQSLGPESIFRNAHVWGYFEGTVDLTFARDSVISHTTWLYFQNPGSDAVFDVRAGDGVEISNNMFASLAKTVQGVVLANDGTTDLTVAGNVAEGFNEVLSGIADTDSDVTAANNAVGELEVESPRAPLILADSGFEASTTGVAEGVSLDGVELEGLEGRLPGAFQTRSQLSLPRRTVITVGENTCGGSDCDVNQGFENELQFAAHSAWPGSRVEVYPSGEPYAGPVVISWPTEFVGVGANPEDVVIEPIFEDEFLEDYGLWFGADFTIIDVIGGTTGGVKLENFTVHAGANDRGITHEGNDGETVSSPHEISRVVIRDIGTLGDEEWASPALYLGDAVIAHDILVHGEFRSCVRFGPRPYGSHETPESEAFVYNLTCRLTKPLIDGDTLAAFEVASVDGGIIANAAVEMAQEGPLFRAQRRSSGDADPVDAVDKPIAFHAEAIAAEGHDALYDGFTDADGTYTLVAVDAVIPGDPFFVSATDSHLDPLAIALDSGIDPSMLNGLLSLGTSLDGTDRETAVPDRGCYEEGM